jgi:hypothetical protein
VIGIYQQSKITDDMIDNIRKDLEKGKITKIAIAEKYKIDRNIVTQIEKGNRVKSTEVTEELINKRHQEKEAVKMTKDKLQTHIDKTKWAHEQSAITKRSASFDQIFEILNYTKAHPTVVYKDMVKTFPFVNETQIKYIISGKTGLYQREFEGKEYTYQYYLDLLKEIEELKKTGDRIKKGKGNRKLSADVIISVVKMKTESPPTTTYKDIGKMYNLTSEQVRSILAYRTKCFEEEFPIQNITYQEYLNMLGIQS